MQVQVNIGFEQLVKIVKKLPANEWTKLKSEVEKKEEPIAPIPDLEQFLLSAPTFSKKQIDKIESTRKAINHWRTK